jgi:adenylylsulfate kinase-like enzyme
MGTGWVIWISGLSGAGKSTLAARLLADFENRGLPVELLEAETVRSACGGDLGYSREERLRSLSRIVFCASLLAKHGVNVIAPGILPYNTGRQFIRRRLKRSLEIHIRVDMAIVEARDTKGLYARARAGIINNVIGIDLPPDIPDRVDLLIDSGRMSPTECYSAAKAELLRRLII